jgi:predicted transcriptional regulator
MKCILSRYDYVELRMTAQNTNLPDETQNDVDFLELTGDIVAAYVTKNSISAAELPDLIRNIYATFSTLGNVQPVAVAETVQKPAVPISKSITEDYIVCLEDGKRLKMLKRYLRTQYGLTPEDYRRKWKLPADYPMVAPAYAERRSNFAKEIGLGRGVRKKTTVEKARAKKG